MNNPHTLAETAVYASRHGRKGNAKLLILYKLIPYLEAVILSEPGKTILAEDSDMCMALMEKCFKGGLSVEEWAELNYLQRRLDRIANKLHDFQMVQNEIMEKVRL